ncbi:MAG: hypothetical protein HYR85_10255 [Planctomycetes bacterium]|nr:hypothetical protein [Planctomycetota bacterium]
MTTARILLDKALSRTCGQECVDWALAKIDEPRAGRYVKMLAGLSPPYSHFEVAVLRDGALAELGIPECARDDAIREYVKEQLRSAVDDSAVLPAVLNDLRKLWVETEYPQALYDFWLLSYAREDLLDDGVQFYWSGADRSNVDEIIRARATELLAGDSSSWAPGRGS